jgi:hypothetical protein
MITIICYVKNGRPISVGDKIKYKSDRYGIVEAEILMLGQKATTSYNYKTEKWEDSIRDIIKVKAEKKDSRWGYITNLRNTNNITKVESNNG